MSAVSAWWCSATEPATCCHTDVEQHCTHPATWILLLVAGGGIAGRLPFCEEHAEAVTQQLAPKQAESEGRA